MAVGVSAIAKLYDKTTPVVYRAIKHLFPWIFNIVFSGEKEYVLRKKVLGFILGIALGAGLYFMCLEDLELAAFVKYAIAGFISLSLGFGYAQSAQIRCACLLAFPTFFGAAGRGFMTAVAWSLLISGPIDNMGQNANEVVRVFTCSTMLRYNLTRTQVQLYYAPMRAATEVMQGDAGKYSLNMERMSRQMQKIEIEMLDDKEIQKLQRANDFIDRLQKNERRNKKLDEKYHINPEDSDSEVAEKKQDKKLELRCHDIFNQAVQNCRKTFSYAYGRCRKKVTVLLAWAICPPLKLDNLCELSKFDPSSFCVSNMMKEPGVGEGWVAARNAARKLRETFNIRIQYKLVNMPQKVNLDDARQAVRMMREQYDKNKNIFLFFLKIAKRILAIMFIRIIMNAFQYHGNYLKNVQFDNNYITAYFRKIDARRHKAGKYTLLPLKKSERNLFVDPLNPMLLRNERRLFINRLIKLIIEVAIITVTIVLLDHFFWDVLDMVRRHSLIEYHQTGFHNVNMYVTGDGPMSMMMQALLDAMNTKYTVDTITTNKRCLPQPQRCSRWKLCKLYGTYGIILVMSYYESYGLRLRRAICAYFYRKHEKARVLFLYNKQLRRRVGYLKYMRHRVRKKAKEFDLEQATNVLTAIAVNCPLIGKVLRKIGLGTRPCLICDDPETKDFCICPNNWCNFAYCPDCWEDAHFRCYACEPEHSADSESMSDMVL